MSKSLLVCKIIWQKIVYCIFWKFGLGQFIHTMSFTLITYVLCCNFVTFTQLLKAILILFNKTEYTINDNDIFSWILSDLIPFLSCFFLWCFLSNSGSMIILAIWSFNLLFLVCIDNRIIKKVGTRYCCLHNFMYSMPSFVLRLSNDRKMFYISFTCFLLINLKIYFSG